MKTKISNMVRNLAKAVLPFYLFTLLPLFTSCSDFLDTESPSQQTSQVIYENEGMARSAIMGVYSDLAGTYVYGQKMSVNWQGVSDIELASGYNGDPSKIRRSPGSTIKPIVCFAPAIEKGIIVPITPILDEKTSFGSYCPSNYKNEYHGWVSCEYALKNSLNIPAVKLLDYVGLEYAKKFANNLGIKTSSDEGLALALGGMTSGTSLKEIASVYSTFARSGLSKESSYINSIFINNKLVYSNPIISHRVMKEETAYLINEMLCECVQSGTAKTIKSLPNVWAAKTGTVGKGNNNTDAYCIAYSTDYTIGVHIFDAPTVTGGNLPAKLANKLIMSDIISTTMFKVPNSILKIDIDGIEYNNNHKVIVAKKSLPQKDKITASFPTFNLPMHPDERSDYEKSLDFFDMNNFTIVDSFFD